MSDAIIDRNRRAVYHALSGVFSDTAVLIRAFDLWERQFADQRGFRVNLYVNAVAQEVVLSDAQVRTLASNLYAAMTTPERNLPQLPSALRARSTAEVQQQPKPAPATDVSLQTGVHHPRLAVFTNLLAAMIDGVTRAQKFRDFLEALDAQTPDLAPATLRERTLWVNSGLTRLRQFVNIVPDGERRTVVNDMYVALCDACGPVSADRILSAAVETTEKSAEAPFCSPRMFL
jgi:hypothetical protein